MKGKRLAKLIIYNAIILMIGLIMIYPLIWMLMSSFKETNTIFKTAGQLIPTKWVFENYVNGWKGFGGVSFGRFFLNSLFISVTSTLGTIVSSALVGFGFSRFQFRGKKNLICSNAGIHDASGTGSDDSAISVVPESGLGWKLSSSDYSIFFCYSGIFCISH